MNRDEPAHAESPGRLQVEAREGLADFAVKLQEIEMRPTETEEQIQRIRVHHLDLLGPDVPLVDAAGAAGIEPAASAHTVDSL